MRRYDNPNPWGRSILHSTEAELATVDLVFIFFGCPRVVFFVREWDVVCEEVRDLSFLLDMG